MSETPTRRAGVTLAIVLLLALVAALCQVLRNTVMKRLGHSLDEYINVWGRFTFLLPFAAAFVLWKGVPEIKPGFFLACACFAVSQTISTMALLENGIEDEKASAGKHRASGHLASCLGSARGRGGHRRSVLVSMQFQASPTFGSAACQSAEG